MTSTLTAHQIVARIDTDATRTVFQAQADFLNAAADAGVQIDTDVSFTSWGPDGFRYQFADGSALYADVPTRGVDSVLFRADTVYTPRQIDTLKAAGLTVHSDTCRQLAVLIRGKAL